MTNVRIGTIRIIREKIRMMKLEVRIRAIRAIRANP
jgi:hypothetical protein